MLCKDLKDDLFHKKSAQKSRLHVKSPPPHHHDQCRYDSHNTACICAISQVVAGFMLRLYTTIPILIFSLACLAVSLDYCMLSHKIDYISVGSTQYLYLRPYHYNFEIYIKYCKSVCQIYPYSVLSKQIVSSSIFENIE